MFVCLRLISHDITNSASPTGSLLNMEAGESILTEERVEGVCPLPWHGHLA